ncbi:MAG: DGQHR domain-containing protein [Dehalococcoidia bacterium]|nr:DGQHR domain-containing protein [Dehalococcoidia bacterium]
MRPKGDWDKETGPYELQAIVVHQWLHDWETVRFSDRDRRVKPQPHFLVFSISAALLRRLSGIYRRRPEKPRSQDLGIQRRHEEERSREIARYVRGGFPWSVLKDNDSKSGRFGDLQMPGWLPTAIVANILPAGSKRYGRIIDEKDVVRVSQLSQSTAKVMLPQGCQAPDWRPSKASPIEIIDGQHRLWAFEKQEEFDGTYEMPVVAFLGLDITWQAYLFWTINIKPKRINASLAFDLYPLLRTQEWLERFEGPRIYRETGAQELTEVLWAHPGSPWKDRINMLGEPGGGDVTQAAFIRSLMASYVKRREGPGVKIGGLFGEELSESAGVLPWSRLQQASFLIMVWQEFKSAINGCNEPWAKSLRKESEGITSQESSEDPAFSGRFSLLATDQGVRAVLQVTNDLCFVQASDLDLAEWQIDCPSDLIEETEVTGALKSLRRRRHLVAYLKSIAECLAKFDWRTSAAPGLEDHQRRAQMVYRGSGGYKELRKELLLVALNSEDESVRLAGKRVLMELGYQKNET